MSWNDGPGLERRPLVFVEDHLYHTTELLTSVAAREAAWLSSIAVCALGRPGPDTDATIAEWQDRFPDVRVWRPVAADLAGVPRFTRAVAQLLRPGGILVQDIQLQTLPFIPADRWWESIYVAATVRGLFGVRPPLVRFLSNKKGYAATFGRDLLEAGFDPRDVMDKSDLAEVVVPALLALASARFPRVLRSRTAEPGVHVWRVSDDDGARQDVMAAHDLVLWTTAAGLAVGGRLVDRANPLVVKTGSHEAGTWMALVEDLLAGGPGLAVLDVGRRVSPVDAERAEITNLAARHLHTLRSRLRDPAAIVTADRAYRLSPALQVAIT